MQWFFLFHVKIKKWFMISIVFSRIFPKEIPMRNWMLWLIYGRELVVLITDGLVCKFLLCKMNIFVSKNGHNYSLVKSARVSPFPSNSSAISMIWCIFGTLCFVHYCKRFWQKYAKSLSKYHKQTTFILFFFSSQILHMWIDEYNQHLSSIYFHELFFGKSIRSCSLRRIWKWGTRFGTSNYGSLSSLGVVSYIHSSFLITIKITFPRY